MEFATALLSFPKFILLQCGRADDCPAKVPAEEQQWFQKLYAASPKPSSQSGFLPDSNQADAAFELWQTECLHGMVFALRESFVRNEQARRETQQAIRILPETESTGHRKTNHWENRKRKNA